MRDYLYNLSKFHASAVAVQFVLALVVLLPSMAEEVRGLWWLAALACVLSVGPVLLVLRGSTILESQEPLVAAVYFAGHLLLFIWLTAWLPIPILTASSLAFVGLLAQTAFYESRAIPEAREALIAAGSTAVVVALVMECTLLANWAIIASISLLGKSQIVSMTGALAYLSLFTSACFRMVEDRPTPTLTLAGEALLLWKYYVEQARSLISH